MNLTTKLAIVLVLLSSGVFANENNAVRFEQIERVSVKELWSLTANPPIFSNRGAVMGYWSFDVENRPARGEWFGVGIVLAGFGDIDEVPVGVLVWARNSTKFLLDKSREETSKTGRPHVIFASSRCSDGKECDVAYSQLVLEDDGRVTRNGHVIGVVE